MAKAKIPGLSFKDLTNSGSSGFGGRTSTCRPNEGFCRALQTGTRLCSALMILLPFAHNDLHLSVILSHLGLSMRYINQRLGTPTPVLRIRTDELQSISIDPPRQTVPERVLDHSRESVYWVLHQSSFIQDDPLPAIISSQGELLKQVGKHVVTLNSDIFPSATDFTDKNFNPSHPDIKRLVGIGTGCSERNQLWSSIVGGNLSSTILVSRY